MWPFRKKDKDPRQRVVGFGYRPRGVPPGMPPAPPPPPPPRLVSGVAASLPAPAPPPSLLESVLDLTSDERRDLLEKIKHNCRRDFDAVANPRDPMALPEAAPASKPFRL